MSFWRNYYHLVWTTKNREQLILTRFEPALYGYLVNKGAELGVFTHAVGGCADHIHMVAAIPPKHAVAHVVKVLKGASSFNFNHVIHPSSAAFAWGRGYGCFTMGESQLAVAVAYVQHQKQHHASRTTNVWLERSEEFDEGPIESGGRRDGSSFIKEDSPDYVVNDREFPF